MFLYNEKYFLFGEATWQNLLAIKLSEIFEKDKILLELLIKKWQRTYLVGTQSYSLVLPGRWRLHLTFVV